jgi:hypothetical protein
MLPPKQQGAALNHCGHNTSPPTNEFTFNFQVSASCRSSRPRPERWRRKTISPLARHRFAGMSGRRIWSTRPCPRFGCPRQSGRGRRDPQPQADAEFLPPEAVACLLAPSTRSHLRFCIPGWRCRSGRQSKSCPGRNSHSAGIRGYTSGGTSKGGIMRARSSSSSSMTKCCCS